MQWGHESERMVLRERPGDQVAVQLAAAADWTPVADNADQPYAKHTRELNWGVRRGVHVHLIHDMLSEYGALVVLAEDPAEGQEFERLLRDHLNPLTDEELLETFAALPDPSDRMLRLMRLALAAPTCFTPEYRTRLEQAATDPDPRLRDALVLAIAYIDWPELNPLLEHLATEDSHPEVREDARNSLHLRTA